MWPLLLLMILPATGADVFITQSPTDVRVSEGGSVRFPCRAHSQLDDNMTVYWSRNGFAMALPTMKSIGEDRYHVRGPLDQGVFDLEINPVKLKDEGEFQCQVSVRAHSIMKLSDVAKLEVLVPPNSLFLIQTQPARTNHRVSMENPAWAELGTQIRLLCIVEGGKPPPQVVWALDSQRLEVGDNGRLRNGLRGRIVTDLQKDGVTIQSTKSSLYLKMTHKVQNKRIRCGVKNEYPKHYVKPVYARLQVRSKPKVRISVEGGSRPLKEHQTVTMRCSAEGYPNSFKWRWTRTKDSEETVIPDVAISRYRFQIRRDHNGATVRCTATNFASGSASVKLNIHYGPKFRNTSPQTQAATLGDSTQLQCDVDSNPAPTISWVRDSYPTEIGSGPLLVLPNVDSSDLGTYTCVAHVPGFVVKRHAFILGLAGKPIIKPKSPVYRVEGESAKLICNIFAIPKPVRHNIRWTKRGQSLIGDNRHHIYTRDSLTEVKFVMYITHVEDSDFGDYNCSAANTMGSSWAIVSLKKKDELPLALAVGLGGAGLLILILLLLLIVFFVRRSRQQDTRKQGYLPGESRPSDGPPSVYGCGPGSTSNDFSNKEASWLRGEARHSYFHVPSELGEMHGPAHPLALDASREATLRRIMEWRDDGSPIHPSSVHASTNHGSPMHSSTHQATHHQFISDRGSAPPTDKQQPSNSDSGISNDNFYSPNSGILPVLGRNHSPLTFNSPNMPISPVRSQGSNRSASLVPSPPLPLFSGPRRPYHSSVGDSSDDTRL